MPYRFKLDENAGKAFRRISREQIAFALQDLELDAAPAESIHASRKAIKRLRALVRAAAPALGAKLARKHDTALRDVARKLSQRRDSDVTLETIEKLEAHFGTSAIDALKPMRVHVAATAPASQAAVAADGMRDIREALAKEGKRLRKAALHGRGMAPVIAGIAQTYRDGRKALKRAFATPTDESIHELRKAVQAHWRHMALLSRCWPDAFAARVIVARDLSQLLGDDHDLAVLKQLAASVAEPDRVAILDVCARRQMQLRHDVRYLAVQLYAEKPAMFADRISIYWSVGRKIARGQEKPPGQSVALPENGLSVVPPRIGSQPVLAAKTPGKVRSQPSG